MNSDFNNGKNATEKTYGLRYIQEFFMDIIDLKKGVDKQGTIDEIKAKKSMSGANAWMLMCSIIIASIGLDRDSDAVIIGAMLISPLMSPILGLGLGIGINDKEVVKKSVIHFSAAIIIALLTSFIYFYFSPFGQITPSIEARTEPLTLDVLVAIFGGLAGIVSIARKDISTTLPGVAIATALMPPLCVTGFGLAKGNWDFALSSFYLFILNTSFISLSTYIIVRYLRFPYRRYINPKERFRNRIVVIIFSLLIIIPSFFILDNVLDDINTKNAITTFIDSEFGKDKLLLDSYDKIETDSLSTLVLKVYGNRINQDNIPTYEKSLQDLGLKNWRILIIKSSEVPLEKVEDLESKVKNIELIARREKEIREAEAQLQTISTDSAMIVDVSKEFKIIFDDIHELSYAEMYRSTSEQALSKTSTFLLDSPNEIKDNTIIKMKQFLLARMKLDSVRLIVIDKN